MGCRGRERGTGDGVWVEGVSREGQGAVEEFRG